MKYLPIGHVIQEWKRSTKDGGEIPEDDLKAFGSEGAERVITGDLMIMAFALLKVKNYKATLPRGFSSVGIALYSDDKKKCLREEVVEWSQQIYGSGCNLKISVDCPNCGSTTACSCTDSPSPSILIDVDEVYRTSHPGYNLQGTNLSHRSYSTSDRVCPEGIKRFKIMRATVSDMFNAPHHIKGCPNLNLGLKSKIEYKIRDGIIEVNFQEGEVLLSYLSYPIDDGYVMVPDDTLAFRAVIAYIEERLAYQQYRKTKNAADQAFYQMTVATADKAISKARTKLSMPDPDTWYELIKTHFIKLIPNWHGDYNFNGAKEDEYTPYKV